MRFLCTALAIFFLLTITPNRGPLDLLCRARIVKEESADRIGSVNTCRKSLLVDRRDRRGKFLRVSC